MGGNINDEPWGSELAVRIASILWIVWGLVHAFAGVVILSADATGALQAVADAVDPASLEMDYPAALGALINQHGFNLFWFGIVTAVCAVFIWRGSTIAIFWPPGRRPGRRWLLYLR